MAEIPVIGAPPPAATEIRARTAYLVVIGLAGDVRVIPNVNDAAQLILEREPSPDEVQGSAQLVHDNIQAQRTAMSVQQAMMEAGQAMAKAQEAAQLRAQLGI